jgi:hypothetical protein
VKSATEASDLLFTVEKLGQTNVAELIPIVGSLAAMANSLGVNIDETGAALALLTQTAGTTAEASTRLLALFTALMKPTQAFTDTLQTLGFSSIQSAIKAKGFAEVLRLLEETTKGNVEATAELVSRKEAMMAMLGLSANGFKTYIRLIDETAKKTGASDKAWKEYLETLDGVWTTMANKVSKEFIKLGMTTLPALKAIIKALGDSIIFLIDNLHLLTAAIAGMGYVIVRASIGSLVTQIMAAVKGTAAMSAGFAAATVALGAFALSKLWDYLAKQIERTSGTDLTGGMHKYTRLAEEASREVTELQKKNLEKILSYQLKGIDTQEAFNRAVKEGVVIQNKLTKAWEFTNKIALEGQVDKVLQERAEKAYPKIATTIAKIADTFKSLGVQFSDTGRLYDIFKGKIEAKILTPEDRSAVFNAIVEGAKASVNKIKQLSSEFQKLQDNLDNTKLKVQLTFKDIIEGIRAKAEGRELGEFDFTIKGQESLEAANTFMDKGNLEAASMHLERAKAAYINLSKIKGQEYAAIQGLEKVEKKILELEDQRVAKAGKALEIEKQKLSELINQGLMLKDLLSNLEIQIDTKAFDDLVNRLKDIQGMKIEVNVSGGVGAGGSRFGGLITTAMGIFRRATGMDTGGGVPGYGGGDKIPRWLEAGEFVLRKEAVRNIGIRALESLNELTSPSKIPGSSVVPTMALETGRGSNTFNYNDRRISPTQKMEGLLKLLSDEYVRTMRRI